MEQTPTRKKFAKKSYHIQLLGKGLCKSDSPLIPINPLRLQGKWSHLLHFIRAHFPCPLFYLRNYCTFAQKQTWFLKRKDRRNRPITRLPTVFFGGDKRDRTADLLNAIDDSFITFTENVINGLKPHFFRINACFNLMYERLNLSINSIAQKVPKSKW